MSLSYFCEDKRRLQTHALEGLKDLAPIHHSHLLTAPPDVEVRILVLSPGHPAWSCNRLRDHLALEGISVTALTIRRTLNDNGMSTRYDRWLKLEKQHAQRAIELAAEQVQFIEKQNPTFRETDVEPSQPVELLCQNTFH